MRAHILSKAAAALALAASGACLSQVYPWKPIRLILPVGPGSGVETSARIVNAKLQEGFGQPVVIDFHAGAMGQIGAEIVVRALPVLRAASDPEIRAKLEASGQTVVAGTPEQLAADIKKQLATVKALVTEAGIKPD